MEKAPSVSLETVWPGMKMKERSTLVRNIFKLNSSWSSVSFRKFGSLCYTNDIESDRECLYTDASGVEVLNEKFAVGPATGRDYVDYGKIDVEFDRGPCRRSGLIDNEYRG
jgi:hypothetical protein